jgi:ribosomal protein S18 acetylase RimI-like enzyme
VTGAVAIRPARKSDAAEMALLMNIAGHNMPSFVWSTLDVEDSVASPIETGRLRAMRDEGSFSWRNTELAEQGDEVVGLLTGYRQPDVMSAPERGSDVHPVFAPLVGLEAKAAGTWYVNALAVYPAWRGRGIGSALLQRADAHAVRTAARGVSLITADALPDAVRLYEKHGYEIREERPFVPYPGGPDCARWLLMVKE